MSDNKQEEKMYGEIEIENAKLEPFDNRNPGRDFMVEFQIPEFTCICPRSGFPDFATINIFYVPDKKCVELKSLKLYINKFRNVKMFHEDVTNLILDDIVKLLDPRWVMVESDFNVRGNIHTMVRAVHKQKGYELPEDLIL